MISLPKITLEEVNATQLKTPSLTKQQILTQLKRARLLGAIPDITNVTDVKLWLTHAMIDEII